MKHNLDSKRSRVFVISFVIRTLFDAYSLVIHLIDGSKTGRMTFEKLHLKPSKNTFYLA